MKDKEPTLEEMVKDYNKEEPPIIRPPGDIPGHLKDMMKIVKDTNAKVNEEKEPVFDCTRICGWLKDGKREITFLRERIKGMKEKIETLKSEKHGFLDIHEENNNLLNENLGLKERIEQLKLESKKNFLDAIIEDKEGATLDELKHSGFLKQNLSLEKELEQVKIHYVQKKNSVRALESENYNLLKTVKSLNSENNKLRGEIKTLEDLAHDKTQWKEMYNVLEKLRSPPLTWTKEKPIELGEYLLRWYDKGVLINGFARVYRDDNRLMANLFCANYLSNLPVDSVSGEWAGPIPEPMNA